MLYDLKLRQKEVQLVFSFIFDLLNETGQNGCHQAMYIIYAATPTSTSSYVALKVSYLAMLVEYL